MRIQSKRRRSRLAYWSRRAALGAIPILLIAAIGQRSDYFDAEITLALMAIGLTLAFCGILGAVLGFRSIWREGRKGFGAAMLGLVLGASILAYPTFLFTRLFSLPSISDVSTDPDQPIAFTAVDWQHPEPTDAEIEAQRAGYPEILPRIYPADAERVFEEVLMVAELLGWDVVRAEPPVEVQAEEPPLPLPDPAAEAADPAVDADPAASPDPGPAPELPAAGDIADGPVVIEVPAVTELTPGYVEAVARTAIVGFLEDVVVRVESTPAGAEVDIRSASRMFEHDFGSNARRIERFFRALDERFRPQLAE